MAATPASRPSPAKKTATKKAAATVAGGGGPEDPVTDAIAAGDLLRPPKAPKTPKSSGGRSPSAPSKALLAEFLICFVVLGLGTLVAPKSSTNNGIPRLMLKSSALAGLFLILALTASVGGKARKTANALGGLVTLTYLVVSPDAISIFAWATAFFNGKNIAQAGQDATSGAVAGASMGDVFSSGTTAASGAAAGAEAAVQAAASAAAAQPSGGGGGSVSAGRGGPDQPSAS